MSLEQLDRLGIGVVGGHDDEGNFSAWGGILVLEDKNILDVVLDKEFAGEELEGNPDFYPRVA